MNSIRYFRALEKFRDGVSLFFLKSGTDRDKICSAYRGYISYLSKDDLPETCHSNWDYLTETLNNSDGISEVDIELYGTIEMCGQHLNSSSIKKVKRVFWEMYQDILGEILK